MVIYLLIIADPIEGRIASWHRSEAAARKARVHAYKHNRHRPEYHNCHRIEIERGKKALLEFLNEHFTRDNG